MCRIEERVYIKADGQSQKFEDSFPCHKSKQGKLCSNVKRKTTEYYPKLKPMIRDSPDGTISPASYDPPTPDGSGSYLVQQHRPSIVERRPSMREGSRAVRPEIIIEFESKKDKDRSKKYPAISVNNYKRASLGAASTNSNDFAIESPGSDASFTVRTGVAETPASVLNLHPTMFHEPNESSMTSTQASVLLASASSAPLEVQDVSISSIADKARRLLLCCQEFQDEEPKRMAGVQLSRFSLWTSNIGVFSSQHASLDYRLRTAPMVKIAIDGNLEILCQHLLLGESIVITRSS
jgi:hypothetical protein